MIWLEPFLILGGIVIAFLVGEIVAVVRADTNRFRRDMSTVRREGSGAARDVNRSLDGVGHNLSRIGMLARTAMTGAIVVGARRAVREFALLEGAMAKFNVVFGEFSGEMNEWVDSFRRNVPLARREIVQHASAMQDLLVPMGIAREEATGMTQQWLELAAALAAFNDVPVEQALQAIQSGIAGQSRPLRQFGIDVRETALQQVALQEGLIRTGETMDENARQQALLIQAYRNSKDAVDGYADQLGSTLMIEQELGAAFKDTLAVIGEKLQPAYNMVTRELANLFTTISTGMNQATRRQVQLNETISNLEEMLSRDFGDMNLQALQGGLGVIGQQLNEMESRTNITPEIQANIDRFEELHKAISLAIHEVISLKEETGDVEIPEEPLRTIAEFEAEIKELQDAIKNTFDRNEIIDYEDQIEILERRIASLLGTLKPDTDISEPIFDVEDALKAVDEAMEELLTTMDEDEFEKIPEQFHEMSDASRLFTRTLADGLNQVLFQARSVSDALDGIIRQLGSRALIAGLASHFGGGAVSFSSAFFGGFRASGGGVNPGRAYVVGEQGPELFMPDSGGSIVSNSQLSQSKDITIRIKGMLVGEGTSLKTTIDEVVRIDGRNL